MDTRFWGPSAWELLHLISFSRPRRRLFELLTKTLPCKFCRMSTAAFMADLPYDSSKPAFWLYKLHGKVNAKLRAQAAAGELKDAPVIGSDPPFAAIETHYAKLLRSSPKLLPGLDFLTAVVFNYDPEVPDKREAYAPFFRELVAAWPYPAQRAAWKAFLEGNPIEPHLDRRADVAAWFAQAVNAVCTSQGLDCPVQSPRSMTARCRPYSSSCKKITCRAKERRDYAGVHARLLRAS